MAGAKKTAENSKAEELAASSESERIIDTDYTEHMEKSYLDYSMSVIVSRALPDARDGLKPVQRRILYDMKALGTTSDKPYRKSARIVGDTMGKFHPHGDSSIYDALVVLSQDFKKELPLVDGHGNFGSIEGDGAAASRYTEARLQKVSEETLLSDLDKNVVDFVPNYDETEKEPSVLPAKIPNFLINGSEGIAVGMTTNVPPHNLAETIDAEIALIKKPEASTEELMQLLPGPDFPTGGIVANKNDLLKIYETGEGKIKVRGKAVFENDKNGKQRIVITEIPYTMIGTGIEKFLQDVVNLAETKVLHDVTDISNQSSKEGIRIVIEFKKDADIHNALNILYKKTKLEDTFGVNALAIVENRPKTLGLKEALQTHIDFLYETQTRKYTSILAQAEKKKEVQEGLIKAVDCVDLIIEILRGSKTRAQAKKCLTEGITDGILFRAKKSALFAKKLLFTETQAEAIMAMQLQRLIGLEIDALKKDLAKSEKEAAFCHDVLEHKPSMTKLIVKELEEIKAEYSRPRRTEIKNLKEVVVKEEKEKDDPCVILFDRFGYVHSVDISLAERNADAIKESYRHCVKTSSLGKIVIISDDGMAYLVPVKDIPAGKLRDKGVPVENLCNFNGKKQMMAGIFSVKNQDESKAVFVTARGLTKRVPISLFDISRKESKATKLEEGDSLIAAFPEENASSVFFTTKNGEYLWIKLDALSTQKRMAAGARSCKLRTGDSVTGAVPVSDGAEKIEINGRDLEAEKMKLFDTPRRTQKIPE